MNWARVLAMALLLCAVTRTGAQPIAVEISAGGSGAADGLIDAVGTDSAAAAVPADRVCETETVPSLTAYCSRGWDHSFVRINHCAFGSSNGPDALFGCRRSAEDCERSVSYGLTRSGHPHVEFLRPDFGRSARGRKRTRKFDRAHPLVPYAVPLPVSSPTEMLWHLPRLDTTSSIRCVTHTRHTESAHICLARNIAIDFSNAQQIGSMTVLGPKSVRAYCRSHGFSRKFGEQQHGASWNALFQQLDCRRPPPDHSDSDTDADAADAAGAAAAAAEAEADDPSGDRGVGLGACDVYVNRTTVAFSRDEWRSYFHTLGDVVRLFAALHHYNGVHIGHDDTAPVADRATDEANRDARDQLQLLLLDTFPRGPFWPLWLAFSSHPPLRSLPFDQPDSDRAANPLSDDVQLSGRRVCFRSLVLSFPCRSLGGGWDRANIYSAHPCPHARMFLDFKRMVVNHLARTQQPAVAPDHRPWTAFPLPALRAVLTANGTTASPADGSLIVQMVLIHRPKSYSGRQILNEPALLEAVRLRYGGAVRARAVDFGRMPLAEQLAVVRSTHILVGMHGAGLTHIAFMRAGSVAIELCNAKTFLQSSYQNIATHNGVHYLRWINAHLDAHQTPPPGAVTYDGDEITANVHVNVSEWRGLIHEALHRLLTPIPQQPDE